MKENSIISLRTLENGEEITTDERINDAIFKFVYYFFADSIREAKESLEQRAESGNQALKEITTFINVYKFDKSLGIKIDMAAKTSSGFDTRKAGLGSRFPNAISYPIDVAEAGGLIMNTIQKFIDGQEKEKQKELRKVSKVLRSESRKFCSNKPCEIFNPETDNKFNILPDKFESVEGVAIDDIFNQVKDLIDDEDLENRIQEEITRRFDIIQKEIDEFKSWAEDNGSDYLKLKIKYNQSWVDMARMEFASQQLKGFKPKPQLGIASDPRLVKDATFDELVNLDEIASEQPDFKFSLVQFPENKKSKYIACEVNVSGDTVELYKELEI